MNPSTHFRLSFIMFLIFLGAWFITMATYVKFIPGITDLQTGNLCGTHSVVAIIAPFIIEMIVTIQRQIHTTERAWG